MDYGEAEWLFTKRSLAKTCLTPFSMLWAPQREQYLKKYFRVYHFSKLQFEKNQFTYIWAFIYIGQFL